MTIEGNLLRWLNPRTAPSLDAGSSNELATGNHENNVVDAGNFIIHGTGSRVGPGKLFSFSELDIDSIENGRINISVPLKKGLYLFPGIFSNAKVKVKDDCHALLSLVVNRNEKKESIIKGASIEFNPPLKIKNPASTFRKSNKFVGKVKDFFADIVLRGLAISQEGKIHLDGYLSMGILGRKDINTQIKPDAFPLIDLRLKSLLNKATNFKDHADSKLGTWTLFDVLKQVGAVTEQAQYSLDLKTDPIAFEAESENFSSWTQKSRTDICFAGTAKITSDGEIEVASNPLESFIKTDDMSIHCRSETVITNLENKQASFMTHVGAKTKILNINAKVDTYNFSFPINLGGENNEVDTQAFVFHDRDGQTKLKDASSLSFKVDSRLPQNYNIKVPLGAVNLANNNLNVTGGLNLESVGEKLQINSGSVKLEAGINDIEAEALGYTATFKGNVGARVVANQINKPANNNFPTFSGLAHLEADPAKALDMQGLNLGNLRFDFNYDFKSMEKVKIEALNSGLTEFIAPLTNLVLSPEKIVDPKLPSVGDIGSEAWRNRIQELTSAPIRAGNAAELLIDGIMSFPKRLEMIRNAKDFICVQTLIFQDDVSGMKLAQELIKAKKRGVKIYVIIDGLGNSVLGGGGFEKNLIKGNKIYYLLNNNGINLQLYSDTLGKGIRELLEAVLLSPELQDGLFNNITSIKQLLQAVHFLVGVASRKIDLGLNEKAVNKLRSGLAHVWGGAKGLPIDEALRQLAALSIDNEIDLADILRVVRQFADLNHRWHEKRFIVDGKHAIMGGMNIADSYMLGGADVKVPGLSQDRTAWRDTDIYFSGPAVQDAYEQFSNNWQTLVGERLPALANWGDEAALLEGVEMQIIQNRPLEDGSHRITNTLIESLKSLKAGEKYYAASAYFVPTGALAAYASALKDAAQRGVDVRIVTNSKTTTDLPQLNKAFAGMVNGQRDLLGHGVRLFERIGDRTMHTKCAVIGSKVGLVGSSNNNNRSASLDSEDAVLVHNEKVALDIERMILADMAPEVAKEILLKDIEYTPLLNELENAAYATFKDVM